MDKKQAGRPRKPPRHKRTPVKVYLSAEEIETLQDHADDRGMALSAFVRSCAMAGAAILSNSEP